MQVALLALFGVILFSWPSDYFIFQKNSIFWWFVVWRSFLIASLIVFLTGLYFSTYIREHVNISTIVVGCMVAGVAGYATGRAAYVTEPTVNAPWFYVGYIVPFLTTLLSFTIGTRIICTILCTGSFVGAYVLGDVDFLYRTYPISALIVVGGSVLLSIVIGHIIYHLIREDYFREKQLEDLAQNDQLTGLFNRRELESRLEGIFAEFDRYGTVFSVMMIDLDYFKDINDTYGHPAGDRVISRMGEILEMDTRVPDISGRYGGEEFCVIMPETELDGAETLAERIMTTLRECTFETSNNETFSVTCSIGIAQASESHDDWQDPIQAADEALYEAKESGRDQVVCG